jgi:hypothetical protein
VGARRQDDEGTNTTGDIGRIELGGVRYLVRFAAKGRCAAGPFIQQLHPMAGLVRRREPR